MNPDEYWIVETDNSPMANTYIKRLAERGLYIFAVRILPWGTEFHFRRINDNSSDA